MNSNCNLVVNNNVIIKIKNLVIFLSLASIVCLFGFSCEKDVRKDNLPSATTIGASTLGFLVDGKVWVAKSDDFKLLNTTARHEGSLLYIRGINSISHITMALSNPQLDQYQFATGDKIEYKRYDSTTVFSLEPSNTSNSLIITRYDGNILSGKFSFKLKSLNGTTVSITSGRFDIPVK